MSHPARILLIDDDAVDRMRVRRALAASDLPHELIEAPDGTTGLAAARAAPFDCVLLDYRLPDVDAFDLLADLLSPEGGTQAVMMLTGEANPDIAFRLMRSGALDHLAKAEVTPSGLARAIRYAQARRAFLGERDAARRDAEATSAALAVLNRQKSSLFSIIAHDLRNPFQVVLGLSDMLSRAVATRDHATIERRAQAVRQGATQAHTLMESLFKWASLQMDSMEVAMSDLDLDPLIADAIIPCRDNAEQKNVAIHIKGGGLRVHSNADMLQTILRNLVANAVKFTQPGGTVTIAATLDTAVFITVTDTGIGISPEVLDNLFKLDRRVTTAGTAGESGSGLGLLLCKDLADRLGTDIEVRSEPGQGTVFRLRVPQSR